VTVANSSLPPFRARHLHNPRAERVRSYGARQLALFNEEALAAARHEIASWPGYGPTPLVALPGLAKAARLAALWYKDEGKRFALQSFKALGGAYAVFRYLARVVAERTGRTDLTSRDLLSGRFRELTRGLTVCSATDGNHGRSVAWGAQLFGCASVIVIGAAVSEGRKRAIESYEARVIRIAGNYDEAVRYCAEEARRNGWQVISDTSWPGYTEVPVDVMQGYALMTDEILTQLPAGSLPSHVFVQGGVGGLAAAVCATLWRRLGARRARFIVVEPEAADCIFKSLEAGRRVSVEGSLETFMAGLSAGEVSVLAWDVLEEGADDAMTVEDAAARHWMAALARGVGGDPPVVAGESAVAGLAAALAAAADPGLRARLELDASTRLLVIGTEGATDPELYHAVVGLAPEAVAARA